MTSIRDLRKNYQRGELDEHASAQDPLRQFQVWLREAIDAKLPEPNAMTLATVGPDGRPSTRVVLVKQADERGLVWYTNYNSRKGRDLAANPFAALQFHWVEMERVAKVRPLRSAINKALAPYEAAFWTWGGYVSLAFICFLWGLGLDERLHRMKHPRNEDRGRRGSAPSGGARSRR